MKRKRVITQDVFKGLGFFHKELRLRKPVSLGFGCRVGVYG